MTTLLDAGTLTLELAAVTPRAEGVVELTLTGADLPAWEPGAHVDLVLAPGLVRQYSLCSDPADRTQLRVAVLREPASRGGSEHVHSRLAVGDRIEVHGPRNHFHLVDAPAFRFIAGGIGITPILPMVAAVEASGRPWSLHYGGRSLESMAFVRELQEAYGSRVTVVPQDVHGLLDLPAILAGPAPGEVVFCCGPEPLLLAVEAAVGHWPAGSLHVERFAPKDQGDVGPDTAFEVQLVQSGRTVIVEPGVSIVDALDTAGIAVETSCREGTCGTCETAVLGGLPDHRDSLLSDDERDANDTMFVCVSRSLTPRLVLDR